MPRRVAAAECEPWAKTGGLADVVDALARALGRRPTRSPDRSTCSCRATAASRCRRRSILATTHPRVPTRARRAADSDVTVLDVAARRLPAPPRGSSGGLRSRRRSTATRTATTPTTPGGSDCSVAPPSRRCAPTGGRWTSSTSTTGTRAPRPSARDVRYADDPVIGRAAMLMTLHNLAYHGWTPRERLPQLGLRPRRRRRSRTTRTGIDLLRAGIERAELVNTVSPGLRGRGADAGLRDGPRRCAPREGRPVHRDPQRPRHGASGIRRPTPTSRPRTRGRTGPARRPAGADLLARVGFDPADDGPVFGMIGRLDPQKGFDLLAGAAPALAGRVAPGSSCRGAGTPSLADPFRALAARAPGPRRLHRAVRPGDGPADLRRRGLASSMPSRFEPCGQGQMIALRYGTPPIVHRTGGPGRHGRRRGGEPGGGHRVRVRRADCRRRCSRRASGRSRSRAAWGRRLGGLLDRGMAVDFDWTTGSAPRYVDAYRRAIEIRQGYPSASWAPAWPLRDMDSC